MKKILKIIKNNPLTILSSIVLIIIEWIYIYEICNNESRNFSFSIDPSIKGIELFWSNFNKPLTIFIAFIGIVTFAFFLDSQIRKLYKNTNGIFTKEEKSLIKQIHKGKITDFSSLIIKYLKPDIDKFGHSPLEWGGIEFKTDDDVYVFKDPRETILKIKSMVKVISFLIQNNAIEIISKYERINHDLNNKLNPFYVFTKTPRERYYNEYPVLKNELREHFDIDDYDKEIRPIENRLKQYI